MGRIRRQIALSCGTHSVFNLKASGSPAPNKIREKGIFLKSFSEVVTNAELLEAIKELKYDTPTPIQAQTLPVLIGEPTDFIGLAATGTGKTAAFGIPLINKLDPAKRAVQCLILCPTRELALQVSGQIDLLGKYRRVRSVAVYGGAGYGEQIRGLRDGAQIVVGTPGRVVDHIKRGTLKLGELRTVVLDEADEMISMGFKEDLELILQGAPREKCNFWFFTATMDRNVRRVAEVHLKNPKQVQVNKTEVLSTTVEQIYYPTKEGNKPEILCKIVDAADGFYGLVFCQTKELVKNLTQFLIEKGYKADCLHGDKDQNARERTMAGFRDRRFKILVCTDVASRGLDVKDVTHVINYSIPRELELYVHRIGRTARSGKTGIAISLVTPTHRGLISRIEQMTKTKIKEGVLPTRRDLGAKKLTLCLPQFKEIKDVSRAVDLMGEDWKSALKDMSSDEIAARFLMLQFPDIFSERKPTLELPREMKTESRQERPQQRRDRGHYEPRRKKFEGNRGRKFRSDRSVSHLR